MLAALQNWKVQPHEVIKLVGEGIPDSMRGSVWQLLTQVTKTFSFYITSPLPFALTVD